MCGFTLLSLHSDSTGPFLFLWIIHGSPVEGRLNWDVVLLSPVLGGSRALGRKFFVVPNIGAGTREMRAMMVWGLSLCLARAWVQGISLFGVWDLVPVVLCRPRGRRPEMYTGWRTWWPAALPWVTCRVYCFLPGFGLWGIVDAQYILNTSSTSLSSHMPVCTGLVWGMLDGATRGRCLIVLWGRERCPRISGFVHCILDGATRGRCLIVLWGRERCVSGLAFGTRQLWWPWVACLAAAWEAFECVHYIIIDFVSSMYGHWYWRAVVLGPSFWISRAGESGGVVHVAWSLGSWEAGVASECRLCWCLHTGTWCTWGIDQLSCVYFSLYWDLSSRCIGPGMTS